MCIIITKPAGAHIPLEHLKNAWERNPDGAGLCFAEGGVVNTVKGFMFWEEFEEFVGDLDDWDYVPAIFHFRVATHGEVDEDNTHPFEIIPGKLAFAHNGVMRNMTQKNRPELSDTQVFNRYILKQLPHNFLRNAGIQRLINETIGTDKLAFLDGGGNITIYNRSLGVEGENGIWYSNHGFKPAAPALAWDRNFGWVPAATAALHSPPPPTSSSPLPPTKEDFDNCCWYCNDCCFYFSEDELDESVWKPMRSMGAEAPCCPWCGEFTSVVYDPMDIDCSFDKAKLLGSSYSQKRDPLDDLDELDVWSYGL